MEFVALHNWGKVQMLPWEGQIVSASFFSLSFLFLLIFFFHNQGFDYSWEREREGEGAGYIPSEYFSHVMDFFDSFWDISVSFKSSVDEFVFFILRFLGWHSLIETMEPNKKEGAYNQLSNMSQVKCYACYFGMTQVKCHLSKFCYHISIISLLTA